MLKQIRYFQSVVRLGNFTAAAEEHFISQSAISQQIKALENELGVELLQRKKRSFTLTKAGEFFYKKSLVLVADYDAVCRELHHLSGESEQHLKIGVLRGYSGNEFRIAVSDFSAKNPDISVEITTGNHEELYNDLRSGKIDIALNDQRRAFSDEYINIVLDMQEYCIELSANNPIAQLDSVNAEDLKNIPCILRASESQQETEQMFYREYFGIRSEIRFADNIENARMLLIQGKGYMPIEGGEKYVGGEITSKIKLTKNDKPIIRRYCAFIKSDNFTNHTEEFLNILKEQFFYKLEF